MKQFRILEILINCLLRL